MIKACLPLIFVLLAVSCRPTHTISNPPHKRKHHPICGRYKTSKELTDSCQLKLSIRKKGTGYRYRLRTFKQTYRGSAFCAASDPDGFYFHLEKLPWCYNNGAPNDTLPPPDRTDLRLYCTGDTLVFQNYGNVMNDFMILCECGPKFVELIRR